MSSLILAGSSANLVARARTVAMSSADSLFGAARLYDGRSNTFSRFATPAGADVYVTADLEPVQNEGLETWAGGLPTGWTVATTGTGAVTQDTVTKNSGASSAKLNRGTGRAAISQIVRVRSGERHQRSWALRSGGVGTIRARLSNLHTGRYWTGSAWSSTPTDLSAWVSASWTTVTAALTIEAFSVTRRDLVDLKIEFYVDAPDAAGDVWVDDVSILAAVGLCSVHGHNLDALITPQLRASTDNFSGSDVLVKTLTPARPAFYQRVAADTFYRYWRLKLVGTNYSGPIWLGEWWLGQGYVLPREPKGGWERRPQRRQVRNLTPAGDRRTYSRNVFSDRALRLNFQFTTPASAVEFEGEVVERTENGEQPLVIVPYYDGALAGGPAPTDLERHVVLGYIDSDWPVSMVDTRQSTAELTVAEGAFPAADELA